MCYCIIEQRSVFGGSAWTFRPEREQWYLHQFFPEQPDLNYRNPAVVQEMTNVLKFWMNKGVSGFRVDAINHMFESPNFEDEPRNDWNDDPNSYDYVNHIYTKDLVISAINHKINSHIKLNKFSQKLMNSFMIGVRC